MIELGAQWVHGEKDNAVYPLAAAAGETLIDVCTLESTGHADNVVTAYPKMSRNIDRKQFEEFRKVLREIYKSSRLDLVNWDRSLGEYFHQKYPFAFTSVNLLSVTKSTFSTGSRSI